MVSLIINDQLHYPVPAIKKAFDAFVDAFTC